MIQEITSDMVQQNQRVLVGGSRAEIEAKIDAFLNERIPFKALKLILPAQNDATRFEHRGMHVRKWLVSDFGRMHKVLRYDCAVELESEK